MASLKFILLSLLLLLCLSLGSARNKDLLDPMKAQKSDEMHDQNGVTKPSCMPGVGGVGGGSSGGVGGGNGGSSSEGGSGDGSGGGGAYGSGCGENGCNYPPVIPRPPQTGENPYCMPSCGVGGGRGGGVGGSNGRSGSGGGGSGGGGGGGGGGYGSGYGGNGNCNYPPVIPGPPQTGENPYCMPSCGVGGGCGGGVGDSNGRSGGGGGGGGGKSGGGSGGYGSGNGRNGNCNYPPVIPGPPQTCENPYCMPDCSCSGDCGGGVGSNNGGSGGGSGGGGGGGGGGYGSECGGNENCNYPPIIPGPPQTIGPICNRPITQPTLPFPCPYGCQPSPSYGCPNGNCCSSGKRPSLSTNML